MHFQKYSSFFFTPNVDFEKVIDELQYTNGLSRPSKGPPVS